MERKGINHIGRIAVTVLIVAATLGIAMAGGLVRWQGISNFFKGDDTAKTAETKAKVEATAKPSHNANYAHTTAFSGMPFALSVEGCSVTGEAGSMDGTSEIEIMAIDSLPPLAAGMVNVTRGHAGYRLSPAGLRFARPVSVELGYDSLLLPKGHSSKEIRTFLYNSERRHWEALPRDSVMEGSQNIVSQSKQAGEMINAIVQLPELPESKAFTPTMLTELEAAHPATGITMMEPPAANSQGTANLSYPITVPAGRNGLQPNLSVSYSSEAGNGLLGMGWDMQLPAITVDSKWGVPRYDDDYETECYSYNGQELLPSPHYLTQWETRNVTGGKRFRPRTEGSFDSIVRYGNSPTEYYWIVWDKGGTKYYYGTYDGSTPDLSVLLKDGSGNIGHWPLCRVEDMDDNYMTYHYTIREQYDADNRYLGQQLWPDSIVYTGHRNGNTVERGKYRVLLGSGYCPFATNGNESDRSSYSRKTKGNGTGQCDYEIVVYKNDEYTNDPVQNAGFIMTCEQVSYPESTDDNGEITWEGSTDADTWFNVTESFAPPGYMLKNINVILHLDENCNWEVVSQGGADNVVIKGNKVEIHVSNRPSGGGPGPGSVLSPQHPLYPCDDGCDCEEEYPYDLRTDARLGFLRSSKEKLRRIAVYYKDSLVRSYSFCYGSDIFGRAQLHSIRQYGADCEDEPYTHTFDYYQDENSVRLDANGQSVANAERSVSDGNASYTSKAARAVAQAARTLAFAETAIGGSLNLSAGAGGGADVGTGFNACSKDVSVGYSLNYSIGSGAGLATLADINGDGLPDRVYRLNNQVYYKPQIAGSNAFGTERKLGASSFLSDNSTTFHHGPAVNIGLAHGGLGWSSTVSRTSVYFADVNGDGLMDLVNNGRAVTIQPSYAAPKLSGTGECGLPAIKAGDTSTAPISLSGLPSVDMTCSADTLSYDLVRVWKSEGAGLYEIYAPVKVMKDTIPGVTPTLDSIIVSIEFYGKQMGTNPVNRHFLIATKRLAPGDSAWNGNLLSLTGMLTGTAAGFIDCGQLPISEGMLLFRVRSKGGRPVSHVVRWDPQVVLNGSTAKKASECQLLEGSGKFYCPFDGVLRLRDILNPQGMVSSVSYTLLRNRNAFRNYPYNYASPGLGQATYYDDTLHVYENDSLEFIVESSLGDNLVDNQWHPHLYYDSISGINSNGVRDTVCMVSYIRNLNGVATDSVLHLEFHPVPRYEYLLHTMHPLFGGMYGNWGQFQYRHDERDTINMVVVNAFADSIAVFDRNTLDRYGYMNDTDFLKRIFDSGNPIPVDTLDSIRMRFACLPLRADGGTRRHEGISPNSYIDGKWICLGNYVMPEPVVKNNDSLFATQGAYSGTGTVAGSATGAAPSSPASAMVFSSLDKISESSSRSYTFGALMFGASYSKGTSVTTHDLMDLNGDGCPDFIRPGGKVYYSLPHLSIWEAAARQTLPSDGHHLSSNETAGGNFTAQSAHTVQKSTNSGKGQNIIIERSVSQNLNAGVNANTSYDSVEQTLMDINGDGLPDILYSTGHVALDTGYGFTQKRRWAGIEQIGIYTSVAGGGNVSSSTNANVVWQQITSNQNNSNTANGSGAQSITQKSAWKASVSGGVNFSLSLNQHQVTLLDINGDGLPDLVYKSIGSTAVPGFWGTLFGGHVWYRLNNGSGFDTGWTRWTSSGGNLVWGLSATAGANIDATAGATFSWVKVSGSGNGNASITTSGDHIQISDFDGDGLPDLLKSNMSSSLEVCYAHLGRTGLLKCVTYPLGGSVTIDYELTPADVHHSRRWVMTKVEVRDSLPGDGCDSLRTSIRYDHGYYDRTEREFLGFAVVVEEPLDGSGNAIRTNIRYYDNRSVHAKGSLLCDALVNIRKVNNITDTVKWLVTTCSYATDSVGERMGGTRAVFYRLARRQTCFYEGLQQAQITAWEEFDYENTHGNVVRQRQGSTDQTTVEANISHHAQYNNNYCVNRVSSVEITGYKKRTTEVDNKGHYTVFRDYYDNTHSLATRLQYDNYGNVTTMRGPNTTVHYTYDNFVHSYPTAITDTFGVSSLMQNYDFRFGIPITIVDQAGSQMLYTLDSWGRTVTIQGPKEIAAGKPFTIRYTYTGREAAPAGTTRQRAVSMAMTEHYDPQHSNIPNSPDNPIKTYTYCDGLGRIVQTRKEAEIGGVEKLVVSGHTVVDALGRTVASYYPSEIDKDSIRFRFKEDAVTPSTVTYDILDRPLVQAAPDGSITTFQYGFDNSHLSGKMLFSTTTTDANNHSSIELKDVSGKPWAVQAAGQPFVYFNYNAVGDNTKVYSSQPDDWERNYTYDWLGRRIFYQEGELSEMFTYNGGNLHTHIQHWLDNITGTQDRTTQYHYNAHRLDSVCYDDALTTIYHYDQYGRVDSLYDESGVVCYEYGNMGEVTRETRIYALPFLTNALALSTQFGYDSWGRVDSIIYPDNETVNYQYDLGGQLQSIYNRQVPAYSYLDNVTYDRFGAKVSQEYGNGMITSYAYDSYTRRLSQITVTDNSSNPYGDIQYGYDPVGNVTQVTSTCPWLQNQTFTEVFTYDASDQLTAATETQHQGYQLEVDYDDWGKINTYDLTQTDLLQNITTQNAYTLTYPTDPDNPQDAQTNFAPTMQLSGTGGTQTVMTQYTFGINGSLRKKEHIGGQQPVEYFLFNSASNLKAYSYDKTDFAYYGYNAANTRTYKLSCSGTAQWRNGILIRMNMQLQQAMFYPNAYINFNHNGEYTKHYYNGSERIASRLGTATPSISTTANGRLIARTNRVGSRFRTEVKELIYETAQVNPPIAMNITSLQSANNTDIFYYHTNHLGSTAYVTDQNQNITQGFLYAPFGEITTEYAPLWQNGTLPKYAFNAKELDEETGMYYYEARYYKPPVFTSRDPMFEKYFWMTPYAYCANNPVKYVDPSGLYPRSILIYNANLGLYGGYKFTPSAAHLLSLVSGVDRIYIDNTIVQERAPGQYRPFYSANKGGGAITLGTDVFNSNITYTENWFSDDPNSYEGHGYGQNIMAWLFLSSHEVGHLPQIAKAGNLLKYTLGFAIEYAKSRHDNAPSEIEADKGYEVLKDFNKFIDETFGNKSLEKLFESNIRESKKIEIITNWWNAYQDTLE